MQTHDVLLAILAMYQSVIFGYEAAQEGSDISGRALSGMAAIVLTLIIWCNI